MNKTTGNNAVNKLDSILGNKKKFKRFLILILVATPMVIGGIAAWKGCSIETKNGGKIQVKSSPAGVIK